GLDRAPTPGAALERLESELMNRAKRLVDAGVADVRTYGERHPADRLPPILFVTSEVSATDAQRLGAVLAPAAQLGVAAVFAGTSVEGTVRLQLRSAATVDAVRPEGGPASRLTGARLFSLGVE